MSKKAERIYKATKKAVEDAMRTATLAFDRLNRCETDELVYKRTQNEMFRLWEADERRLEQKMRQNERYSSEKTRDFFRAEYAREVEVLRRTYLTIANQYVA